MGFEGSERLCASSVCTCACLFVWLRMRSCVTLLFPTNQFGIVIPVSLLPSHKMFRMDRNSPRPYACAIHSEYLYTL